MVRGRAGDSQDGQAVDDALPSADGLARLASALGGGCCEVVGRLTGGVSGSTYHCLHVTDDGTADIVVKRMPLERAFVAAREFHRLQCALRTDLITPTPLALDTDGEWFGAAAFAMTHIPGVANLLPADVDAWTSSLARSLLAIHATPFDPDHQGWLSDRQLWKGWQPVGPAIAPYVGAVRGALRAIAETAPTMEQVFTHADFFPGNVLWEGDEVVGVVDWSRSMLAPREADLANCRAALAVHPGGRAPQVLLETYSAGAPVSEAALALWDVLFRAVSLQWAGVGVRALNESGVEIGLDELEDRARTSLEAAIDAAAAAGQG